jgi:hypothetical protein
MKLDWEAVEKVAKTLGSLSAGVYFFGFLARRSQLNLLGVVTPLPLGDAIYLETGIQVLAAIGLACAQLFFLSLPAVGAIWLFRRSIISVAERWKGSSHLRVALIAGFLILIAGTRRVVEPLLSGRALLLGGEIGGAPWLASDLATGAATAWVCFVGVVALVATTATAAAVIERSFEGEPWKRPVAIAGYGLVALQVLLLPIAYGVLVPHLGYPKVTIDGADASLNGRDLLLLLDTEKALVVYDDDAPRIVTLDRSSVHSISVRGYVNVFSSIEAHPKRQESKHAIESVRSAAADRGDSGVDGSGPGAIAGDGGAH